MLKTIRPLKWGSARWSRRQWMQFEETNKWEKEDDEDNADWSIVVVMVMMMVILIMKQETVNAIWGKKKMLLKHRWQSSEMEIHTFNTYLRLSLKLKFVISIHILNLEDLNTDWKMWMKMFSIVNQKEKKSWSELLKWCFLVQYWKSILKSR